MPPKPLVLVIDDDPMIQKLVPVRLKHLNVRVHCVGSGAEGLAFAREEQPDLVLLDVSMPEMDGFDVCRQLRDSAITGEIPVIFLTGSDDSSEKTRGFELGAVDYVTKPFDAAELTARVRAALRMQALVDALERQAQTDALTGLPNRAAFHQHVTHCIERLRRGDGYRFAVLFIDLDRFKIINDSLGHAVGDQVLMGVSDALCEQLRFDSTGSATTNRNFVARMGGDEFTIILEQFEAREKVREIAERIRQRLSRSFEVSSHKLTVGASIGIRICEDDCEDADALIRDSDTAMYKAKARGKGRCVEFDPSMHQEVARRLQLENDLNEAMAKQQFHLVYHPIVNLETGAVRGVEALLRWRHPVQGDVPPTEFIALAEETGRIIPLGRWVLNEATRQLRQWQQEFDLPEDFSVNVNLSKVQVISDSILDDVSDALASSGVQPQHLTLEITESSIMHSVALVTSVLEKLRDRGVVLAMDDFGKGYSSLASLHRFPIHMLKIDRDFIHTMTQSRAHLAVIDAITSLAGNLGLKVIAEGIEANDEVFQLQALECSYGQGYFFAKPRSPEEIRPLLESAHQLVGGA